MARAKYSRIQPVELSNALQAVLDEYGDEVYKVLKESIQEVREEAVDKLVATSPRRKGGGAYAESWTVSELPAAHMQTRTVIHNKEHYRLTHLLEKGHVTRNGTGRTFRRTPAHPHIGAVDEFVISELPKTIIARLKR